jgi:hypothetical protein
VNVLTCVTAGRLRCLRAIATALLTLPSVAVVEAQTVTGTPPSDVRILPMPPGAADPRVRSISRDGARVLMSVAASAGGPAINVLVLDTASGAVIFDSRLLSSPTRSFTDAVLTPDGRHVIYREERSEAIVVRARELDGPADREIFTTVEGIVLHASSDDMRVLAFTDSAAAAVGIAGVGRPALWVVVPCERGVVGAARLSGDGSHLVYLRPRASTSAYTLPVIVDTVSSTAKCLDVPGGNVLGMAPGPGIFPDMTGRRVAGTLLGHTAKWLYQTPVLLDSSSSAVTTPHAFAGTVGGLSDDARFLLLLDQTVLDITTGIGVSLASAVGAPTSPIDPGSVMLSANGRVVVLQTSPDPNTRLTYAIRLDADADGLPDAWESTFGLDPTDSADAGLDADGDGRTNIQEFDGGTHPVGRHWRYFAEGASGRFFNGTFAIFNPTTSPVAAQVREFSPDGVFRDTLISVPARVPVLFPFGGGFAFPEFSLSVESAEPLVVERRMTWEGWRGYGSHVGSGVDAPARTWHFAEGATIAGLQTFFLLHNPDAATATVTMRYMLSTGNLQERTHVVPGRSRRTVWANQEGSPLDAAEFATTIDADVPIVAERAMYRDKAGEIFSAGSVASGIATPAESWFFAEGATGSFFDTYVLIANPGDAAASVTATYLRAVDPHDASTAASIVRTYTVPARSRRTIWVAQEAPELREAQVSTQLVADRPIVAERTMWWPGPTAASWLESHTESGAPTGGTMWGVADLLIGEQPVWGEPFLLLATLTSTTATARVSMFCADGRQSTRDFALPVHRTTLWLRHEFPGLVGRCAAIVESLPTAVGTSPGTGPVRVPLVVEAAVYQSDFAAGGVTLATRLPDPQN